MKTRVELCDHEVTRWEINPVTLIYTLRCSKDANHILETLTQEEFHEKFGVWTS